MKALIIAAGKGKRLGSYTKDLPKTLLLVAGKPIIDHQLDALAANGITDIAIVKGYLADTIQRDAIGTIFINDDYENNNILASMMYAAEFLDDDVIVSYSDIIYSKDVVATLMGANHAITAVVDTDWRGRYTDRQDHPESEAEKALFDSAYIKARSEFDGKPFVHAKVFSSAYITDLFNFLIESGALVHCAFIQKGWWEIDTEEDLLGAQEWLK